MAEKIKAPSFFSRLWAKIKEKFKYLHTLVMMQLKDKIDFSFLKNKKQAFFKYIWVLIGFIAITAIIYLLLYLIVKFGLFSFLQILNFRAFLVLMTVLLVLAFLSCLINVTSTLYFAKDNPVLLTLPVKNSTIFASKIVVCYIYELLKNSTYILPVLLAYGLVMHLPFTYFLWAIIGVFFLTALIVIICGALSLPAMAITIALKKHKFLEYFVLFLVASALVISVVKIILLIPTDIDLVRDWGKIFWSIQNFLADFAQIFVIFDLFTQLLTGMAFNSYVFNPFTVQNLITFSVCVGIIVICFVLIYYLSKPLFLKMASTPFEYRKHNIKKFKRNRPHSPLNSVFYQQSKQIFRSANLIYSMLAVAVLTPIAILLQNQIISAMNTRLSGAYMGIAFNILIIMLLMLSSNTAIASIYSREGNATYLNKVAPVSYGVSLSGKLILNGIISIASIIVSTAVIEIYAHLGAVKITFLGLSMIFVYLAHLVWSAELDFMNPQNRIYQTSGKQQKNPNESKATLIAFLVSGIMSFVAYFLMNENIDVVFIKLFFIGIIFFAIRFYLYLEKIKLYYKEK